MSTSENSFSVSGASLKASFLSLSFLGVLLTCARPAIGATFIDQVLSDNPRGFWLLNDTNTTATDSSGNAFDGTYGAGVTPQGIAGPSWVPSPGTVANFTGGNISFAAPLNLGGNGYTIEAWINPTLASLQDPSRFVASGTGLDGYGFGTTTGGELVFTSFALQDYTTTTLTLLPNRWYYVGVVLDGSNNASFYVDGSLVETVLGTNGATFSPTKDFTIGSRSPLLPVGPADEYFHGGVAGLSVYDTALTSAQISDQFNAAAAVPEPAFCAVVGVLFAFAASMVRKMARNVGKGTAD